jgi:hypothetical protein
MKERNMFNHCLLEIAYLRQQEMLQQAETERLYSKLKGKQPGVLNRFDRFTGWRLAVTGLLSTKLGMYWLNTKI